MSDHESKSESARPRRSANPVAWLAAALVAAAFVAFVVWPRPDAREARPSETKAEPAPPAEPAPVQFEKTTAAAAPAPARPRASAAPTIAALAPLDLFAGDVPEALRMTHQVTAAGGQLALERIKELYQLGKDHPGDARPHLVMGQDAMNRGWEAFAVDHYTRAQKEDPRARQDSRMLKDLVLIAGGKREPAKGSAALVSIYGAAAIPAVEEALAEAGEKGDERRVQQLANLSQELARPAQ
jgi:hypothetical protein